jgi:two-component system, NtrC family, sensor kinase
VILNRYQLKQNKNKELTKALTELKETQAQLIQQENLASLGQLTAGIAHEINNPVNFVSANVGPLKRDIEDVKTALTKFESMISAERLTEVEDFKKGIDLNYTIEEIHKLLSGIEEGSRRTSEIVKGLRNFSRMDSNEKKHANLVEGIESSLMLLHHKIAARNISVEKKFAILPVVECYPGQLNQVFMNIINNAIDAVGEGGVIKIEVTGGWKPQDRRPITEDQENSTQLKTRNTNLGTNDWVVIKFSDNGCGMTDEVKAKIFDPFFTTKDVGKGTGLGLAISYGIIEKHEGRIEVESERGKGSEFRIYLPV